MVEPHQPRAIARHEAKRWRIPRKLRIRGRHRGLSNPRKLVNTGVGPENGVVFDGNVPGQPGETGNDATRAYLAVMPHVGTVHQVVVVSDSSPTTSLGRPDVNGDVLPDHVVAPDRETRGLTLKRAVLGRASKGSEGMDARASADLRSSGHHGMRQKDHAGGKLDFRTHECMGPYLDICSESSAALDDGGRMHLGHAGSTLLVELRDGEIGNVQRLAREQDSRILAVENQRETLLPADFIDDLGELFEQGLHETRLV